MKERKKIFVLLSGFFLAILGLICSDAYAVVDNPEYHLGITPTQDNLETVQPGSKYSGEFTIKNQGTSGADFEIDFAPYSVKDETYEPVYDSMTAYTDIASWITTSISEGYIEAGGEQVIEYEIDIPQGFHGGSQSAIIIVRLMQPADSSDTAVNTVQQLGYLIFGNVDGVVTKTGKILENKVPSFLFNPPIVATSMVENTGNVYTRASYKLQVFPLFSDEEVYTNEEEPDENIVFPETKRYNEIKWEGAPQLGIFKVRSTVKIFDEESVTEKLVFLCPIWFLFIIALLVFCMIFWIVSRIIKRKKEA